VIAEAATKCRYEPTRIGVLEAEGSKFIAGDTAGNDCDYG
jgi:hypothetical protein